MWKLAIGFAAFAAIALYFVSKGGDSIDMSGEKHGTEATHAPAAAGHAPAASQAPAR